MTGVFRLSLSSTDGSVGNIYARNGLLPCGQLLGKTTDIVVIKFGIILRIAIGTVIFDAAQVDIRAI